jgi:hypothetical protein
VHRNPAAAPLSALPQTERNHLPVVFHIDHYGRFTFSPQINYSPLRDPIRLHC